MAREVQGRRFARPGTLRTCPGRLLSLPEGTHLVVDCEGCSGSSDLSSQRCWAGILPVAANLGIGAGLLHQREIEVRYGDEAQALLDAAAQIHRFLGIAVGRGEGPARGQERRCGRCGSGWEERAGRWRALLLTDPGRFLDELREAPRLAIARGCARGMRCGGALTAELLGLGATRRLLALLDEGRTEGLR